MTIGAPDSADRQKIPRPPTWAMESDDGQPVAGGRKRFHASALAVSAPHVRTAPFGRPVVPEVPTIIAGASGEMTAGGAEAGLLGREASPSLGTAINSAIESTGGLRRWANPRDSPSAATNETYSSSRRTANSAGASRELSGTTTTPARPDRKSVV